MKKTLLFILLLSSSVRAQNILMLNPYPAILSGGRALELNWYTSKRPAFAFELGLMNATKGITDYNPENPTRSVYTKILFGIADYDEVDDWSVYPEIMTGLGATYWEEEHQESFKSTDPMTAKYYGTTVYNFPVKKTLVATISLRFSFNVRYKKACLSVALVEFNLKIGQAGRNEKFPTKFIPGLGYNSYSSHGPDYVSPLIFRSTFRLGWIL